MYGVWRLDLIPLYDVLVTYWCPSQTAVVLVNDSAAGRLEARFSITINNLNDAPVSTKLLKSVVKEGTEAGVLVTNIVTVDRDLDDTFTYTILNKETTPFVIAGSELVCVMVYTAFVFGVNPWFWFFGFVHVRACTRDLC